MLDKFFGSKAKVRIVREAALHPAMDYSIEDLAKAVGMSYGTVYPAVGQLENTRVLVARKAGRSRLFKINDKYPLYREILDLFIREKDALVDIAKEFVGKLDKTGVKSVVLFGSVARGDVGSAGDIDLLLVTKDGKVPKNMAKLADDALTGSDTIISPLCLSRKAVIERIERFDDFILRVMDEGKVLYGDSKWLRT